jgi:hypothetical protein
VEGLGVRLQYPWVARLQRKAGVAILPAEAASMQHQGAAELVADALDEADHAAIDRVVGFAPSESFTFHIRQWCPSPVTDAVSYRPWETGHLSS